MFQAYVVGNGIKITKRVVEYYQCSLIKYLDITE